MLATNDWLEHKTDVPSRDDYYRHMHNEYELLYFIRGAAKYQLEGTVYTLTPGTLLLIRPRVFHCLIPLEAKVYERFVLHFSQEMIDERLRAVAQTAAAVHLIPVGDGLYQQLEQLHRSNVYMEKADYRLGVTCILNGLLLRMKYTASAVEAQTVCLNETLAAILADVDRNPQDTADVQTLMRRYFVSRSWLEQHFREALGMTPLQYLNRKRILYSQTLLRGGLTPTEAARRCGYGNYITFYRNYKKVLGRSPEEDGKRGR